MLISWFATGRFSILIFKSLLITHVTLYRLKDSSGWQQVFTSPYIDNCIERIAINAKMGSSGAGETSKMVAISYGTQVRLWGVSEDGTRANIGKIIKSNVCNKNLVLLVFRYI